LSEPKTAKPQSAKKLQKQKSIDFTETAQSTHVSGVGKTPISNFGAENAQKKHRKTHRRAESEVTALSSQALEAISIPTGNALSTGVHYNAEDVKSRPESVNLSSLANETWNLKSSSTAPASSAKANNAAAGARLHSQIDTRAAIKPSAVKKKKNPGVLFSFNTMLTKKQDRIDREKARFTNKP